MRYNINTTNKSKSKILLFRYLNCIIKKIIKKIIKINKLLTN